MTLNEAIRYAEEQADLLEESAKGCDLTDKVEQEIACKSGKCAEEHRQLVEWLKDYKRLLEYDDAKYHEEHGEVCAILVKSKSFNAYSQISAEYGENSKLLVINPSEVLREVLENVDMSTQIVYALCIIILIMNIFIISVITLLNMYDSKKEIALMRLIGIGMNKINFVYIIQNGIIGFISTILAFICSRLCLMLMGGYVASMGIVLDTAKIYPLEIAIMAVVFVISVLPTVVCTLNMSKKDGINE